MSRRKKTKLTTKEQEEVSKNVEKLVREYKRSGKITTSRATYHPKNLEHAIKIALGIEYGRVKGKRKKR